MKYLLTIALALALSLATTTPARAEETPAILSHQEVKALLAGTTSPASHLKLARHYTALAKKHEAEALEHEELATAYAKHPGTAKTPMSPNTAEHCKYFAEHCRKTAKMMREMAATHEAMAKPAK